jgi:uncharacterized protein (UPF0332 family)
MAESQKDLVDWAAQKAEEYLASAKTNLDEGRLFVAAEEIFRSIENSIEAMLYARGIKRIAFPSKGKEFTGRLALHFLVRENLLKAKVISSEDYGKYLNYATKLHQAGYNYGSFEENELRQSLEFAEGLFYRIFSSK